MSALETNPDLIRDPEISLGMVRPPVELTIQERSWLKTSCDLDYTGWDTDAILQRVNRGDLQLWRLRSPQGGGLLVTEVIEYPAGRELFLWHMGGKGMSHATDIIMATFVEAARAVEAKWLRTNSIPWVADWLEKHTKLTKHYVCLMQEV